jgi:hypothetical protein
MTEGNYSNVGHRGPEYKGLGAMNPCELYLFTGNEICCYLRDKQRKHDITPFRKVQVIWL